MQQLLNPGQRQWLLLLLLLLLLLCACYPMQ
jgi:hypothetical protein